MKPLHRMTKGKTGWFIIGPYDPEFIERIKGMPTRWRSWDPVKLAWKISTGAIAVAERIIEHHYMTPEERDHDRMRLRLYYCEGRLAALRAEKKAALQADWGIEGTGAA